MEDISSSFSGIWVDDKSGVNLILNLLSFTTFGTTTSISPWGSLFGLTVLTVPLMSVGMHWNRNQVELCDLKTRLFWYTEKCSHFFHYFFPSMFSLLFFRNPHFTGWNSGIYPLCLNFDIFQPYLFACWEGSSAVLQITNFIIGHVCFISQPHSLMFSNAIKHISHFQEWVFSSDYSFAQRTRQCHSLSNPPKDTNQDGNSFPSLLWIISVYARGECSLYPLWSFLFVMLSPKHLEILWMLLLIHK